VFLAFLALAFGRTISFTLQYQGECIGNTSYNCSLKATSEGIDTLIRAHGNPDSAVFHLVGSLSVLNATGTTDANGDLQENGQITFGIHSTHEQHTITYVLIGNSEDATGCDGGAATINGGSGTLQGAAGKLSLSCCAINPNEQTVVECWVSGYIVLPN